MHLFANYIQPLMSWLEIHPHWALFITFFISFAESLAIIGSIIPGSITMTAIGILAGSGIMRIDLTFLAATLGAIAGDSGSYAIGYALSDRLTNTWPFKNYPSWITYGKAYFAKHGSTSVLIGRFFGPMRSIIPVIAGMMHMKSLPFLLANSLSAVIWALIYVAPGVLIGTAGRELSAQSATRLFVVILILLVCLWLVGLGIKWLVIHTNQWLHTHLNTLWLTLRHRPRFAYVINQLTPINETNHYATAALVILFICGLTLSIIMLSLVGQNEWIAQINHNVYLFFQSLRTKPFDVFFITISLVIHPLSLLIFIASVSIYARDARHWRTMGYWFSLVSSNVIVLLLLTPFIETSSLSEIIRQPIEPLCPDVNLTIATSLFGFFIFLMSTHGHSTLLLVLRLLLLMILALSSIAILYLGDNWLSSVILSYLTGTTLCLIHWLFYRRNKPTHQQPLRPIILSCLLLTLATGLSCVVYFNQIMTLHHQRIPQYTLTEKKWWNQQQPILPIYSTNRIGHYTGLFHIQYVGSIEHLEQALTAEGWVRQPDSFFYSLLMRAGGHPLGEKFPLTTQLYLNKKPTLVMVYHPSNNNATSFLLRLWPSNYHLDHSSKPIWLGSLTHLIQPLSVKEKINDSALDLKTPLIGFKFKTIKLANHYLQAQPSYESSILLLIKE